MDFLTTIDRLTRVGISTDEIARHMDIGKAYLRQLIRGHQPVRPGTELKLKDAIGKLAARTRKRKSHSSAHADYLEALADYLESLA